VGNDELTRFKTEINLSEYSASLGYFMDKKESSRNSVVMRHQDGDKIIISRRSETWIYFSVRDRGDNGTIIDFLKNRGCADIGQVRIRLRDWLGSPHVEISKSLYVDNVQAICSNRSMVRTAWNKSKICGYLPCLSDRGLKPDVIGNDRFKGCLRTDWRNNALFPHYDHEGICGYEVKNKGFTGFAPGGIKGLWTSRKKKEDDQLVIVESAIDAISYHILHDNNSIRYISTSGELNPQQPGLIREEIEKLPAGSTIKIACDNDQGGDKIATEIRAVIPSVYTALREIPEIGKDWNEMLLK